MQCSPASSKRRTGKILASSEDSLTTQRVSESIEAMIKTVGLSKSEVSSLALAWTPGGAARTPVGRRADAVCENLFLLRQPSLSNPN
eukprot:754260-Hanusia_phi.AAC.1